jgi:uncharacterized membrane protein YeaQ/YmgE (transglycosylase-associated protein family)
MDKRAIAIMLVIGAVAGWLASFVVGNPRWGLVGYIVAGVIGGVVGGWLLQVGNMKVELGHPVVNSIVQGAIGAIAVIVVARLLA